MPRGDAEVVRKLFTALDGQDWEAALGVFDPEVEWRPTEGTFHGLEGVVASLAKWLEPWDQHHIEPEEFLEADDRVVAVIHLTGRGEASGMEVDQRFFQVYEVRNGRIVRVVEFVRRADALEAAGIRE
jgi:ketosteroid isomerase-like protein